MSYNAWETTSPTSLHPLTHFICHSIILYLAPYNDVGDVVSQALLLARPEYLRLYMVCKNSIEHLLMQTFHSPSYTFSSFAFGQVEIIVLLCHY